MSKNKVILVTGASSGFGEATARLFAQKGYAVVIAARRYQRLETLADEINGQGGLVLPVQADVTKLEQVKHLVQTTIEEFGRLDVLFNNAGFGRINWLDELDPEKEVKAQIDVNLLGMVWMAQAVLPVMISQQSGHIVNMVSMAGFVATPTYTIYAATKFAMRGFSEALRREVRIHGIRVSAIYPGGARTEFNQVAGINRKTRIKTPSFMVLSPEQVAGEVWKLVLHPRRTHIIPWLLKLAALGNSMMPGLYDRIIENRFVKPERAGKTAAVDPNAK